MAGSGPLPGYENGQVVALPTSAPTPELPAAVVMPSHTVSKEESSYRLGPPVETNVDILISGFSLYPPGGPNTVRASHVDMPPQSGYHLVPQRFRIYPRRFLRPLSLQRKLSGGFSLWMRRSGYCASWSCDGRVGCFCFAGGGYGACVCLRDSESLASILRAASLLWPLPPPPLLQKQPSNSRK